MKYEKFEQGELVRLDADFNNTSLVTVICQTTKRMYTMVKSDGSYWSVMTDRLSKILNGETLESEKISCSSCKYFLPENKCSHVQGCDGDYELWEQGIFGANVIVH